MKKNLIYICLTMMFAMVLFKIPCCSKQVYAKGAEKISRTSIVTCKEEEELLTLRNPGAKVKWTSSNRRIVKILKNTGKKREKIVFCTKKAGKAVVKAKVGNKTYRCKVVVKDIVSRASLIGIEQTDQELKVKVKLSNNGHAFLGYGHAFWVERMEDGNWIKMTEQDNVGFTAEQILINGKKSVEKTYVLYAAGETTLYKKEDFKPGTYRIHVSADFAQEKYKYVEFEVK